MRNRIGKEGRDEERKGRGLGEEEGGKEDRWERNRRGRGRDKI